LALDWFIDMKIIKTLLLFILTLLIAFCTSNPFFGDNDTVPDNLKISGKVTLQEEMDHSNIFVWLRGINAKTSTNEHGNYSLQLPNPKSLPGGALAWNGELPLYYYMDNYRIDSTMLFILNGEIKPNQENITNSGKVKVDNELKKIIHISSFCDPDKITAGDSVFITVHFEIHQRSNGGTLFTYKDGDDSLKAFYMFRVDDPLGTFEQFFMPPGGPYKGFFNKTLYGTHTIMVNLPKGEYKVIPFVHLAQPGIPKEMFIEIGEYPDRFTHSGNHEHGEFLKMPITFDGRSLSVN